MPLPDDVDPIQDRDVIREFREMQGRVPEFPRECTTCHKPLAPTDPAVRWDGVGYEHQCYGPQFGYYPADGRIPAAIPAAPPPAPPPHSTVVRSVAGKPPGRLACAEAAERWRADAYPAVGQGDAVMPYPLYADMLTLARHAVVQLAADASPDGVAAIAAERRRQLFRLGHTEAHDAAAHTDGELAYSAAAFLLGYLDSLRTIGDPEMVAVVQSLCNWLGMVGSCRPKWKGPRHALAVAGALIAAEIDRLDRSAPLPPPTHDIGGEG